MSNDNDFKDSLRQDIEEERRWERESNRGLSSLNNNSKGFLASLFGNRGRYEQIMKNNPKDHLSILNHKEIKRIAADKKAHPIMLIEIAKMKDHTLCMRLLSNPSTPSEALDYLAKNENPIIRLRVLEHKNIADYTAITLATDSDEEISKKAIGLLKTKMKEEKQLENTEPSLNDKLSYHSNQAKLHNESISSLHEQNKEMEK